MYNIQISSIRFMTKRFSILRSKSKSPKYLGELFCNEIQIIIWNSEELSQILPLLKLQSYLGEIFYILEFIVFICIKSSLYYLWGLMHLYILLYDHIVVLVNEQLVILCAKTVHANVFLRLRNLFLCK